MSDMSETTNNLGAKKSGFIGVFDSGVGGISVLCRMLDILPHERFIFFGDSANAPYGDKDPLEVLELSTKIVDSFIAEGAKAIVIACNTATSAAAATLRNRYPMLPIIGVEPALKPAAQQLGTHRILVLATQRTIELDKFNTLLQDCATSGSEVRCVACPGLVELIEAENLEGEQIHNLLSELIGSYKGWADSVVLGCTHYPFAKAVISDVLGPVTFFDGGEGTARQLARVLTEADLAADETQAGELIFRSSIETTEEIALYKRFLKAGVF